MSVDHYGQTDLLDADQCNRMLAVMTYNVGYFLSVLAGLFIGEIFSGRYGTHGGDH